MTMIPLTRFTLHRGATELRLSPNRKSRSGQGTDVNLPLDGAVGTLDDTFSPVAAVSPLLAFQDDTNLWDIIEPLRLQENVDYDFVIILPMSAVSYERNAARSGDPIYPFANSKLKDCISFNSSDSCFQLSGDQYQLSGRLRYDNYLGSVDLSLRPDVDDFSLRAEVISNKIDYETDFRHLLTELATIHAEIILNLDAPTETCLKTAELEQQSPHMLLLHLRRLFQPNGLPVAVSTILGNPLYRHRTIRRIDNTAFVVRPDYTELQFCPHTLDWLRGGALSSVFGGFTPNTLPLSDIETKYDVIENRFVKHALKDVMRVLQATKRSLPRKYEASHRQLNEWIEQLDEYLIHPFWQSIGECISFPNSMVMQERHGYRDFMQQIMLLDLALTLHSTIGETNPISGDLRPIWELYEIWCYFQLRAVLSQICNHPGEPTIESQFKSSRYSLDLKSGSSQATKYKYVDKNGRSYDLELFYTRSVDPCADDACVWEGSYSTQFKPDFSIRVHSPARAHWIHFDAKYRVSFKTRKGQSGDEGNEHTFIRSFRSDDLNVMHTYRDAILGSRGCYVLYPGNTSKSDIFIRHHSPQYRNEQVGPSIGAFPLCPSQTEVFKEQVNGLKQHLELIILAIVECDDYCEEEGF